MSYLELLQKAPDELKKEIVIQFPGTKPNGKLLFGCGIAQNIGKEAVALQAKKALLVTDKIIASLGLAQVLVSSLEASGIQVDVYDDVAPEPHVEVMEAIAQQARGADYDLVVGLGGGSSLDSAKMASIAAKSTHSVSELLRDASLVHDHLPSILLPTTSGTGSEVSPYIVASEGERKLFINSPHLYAAVAMIDPLLTATMPPKVTAATGLDALSHAVEGIIGRTNPYTLAMAARSIELVFQNLPKAVKDGQDIQARYNMSFASMFGMMAYIQGGGLYAHSVSYILTAKKGAPHGVGCGLALPYTLRFNKDYISQILRLARAAINNSEGFHAEDDQETIECFFRLVREVGMPATLQDLNVPEADLEEYAQILVTNYYRKTNPRSMSQEEAYMFTKAMYDGDLTF